MLKADVKIAIPVARRGLRNLPEIASQVASASRRDSLAKAKEATLRLEEEINKKKTIIEKSILIKGSDYSNTMAKTKGD